MNTNKKQIKNDQLIIGLVRLQDRSANLAAGWLQGGWSDHELSEMMTTGLVPVMLECVRHVDQHASTAPTWFRDAWARIQISTTRLKFASSASSVAIQPVLLLLPLAIDSLLYEAMGCDSEEAHKVKTVAPEFISSLASKAAAIGEKRIADLNDLIDALDRRTSGMVA